jgi:hypothetical protein
MPFGHQHEDAPGRFVSVVAAEIASLLSTIHLEL